MLYLGLGWVSRRRVEGGAPPSVSSSARGAVAGGSWWHWHHPPALCPGNLLALARLEAPMFGTDAEPCGGALFGRPAPGFCFTPLCVQYRLISSKEPMYKRQFWKIFLNSPFVQFKIKHVYTSPLFSTVL